MRWRLLLVALIAASAQGCAQSPEPGTFGQPASPALAARRSAEATCKTQALAAMGKLPASISTGSNDGRVFGAYSRKTEPVEFEADMAARKDQAKVAFDGCMTDAGYARQPSPEARTREGQ